ncbi:MAG: hypothetical protein ACO3JL_19345 [Myxococcota bacterium]
MVRIPPKPQFPKAKMSSLEQSLDRLESAMSSSTDAAGQVDLEQVAAKLVGDAGALEALRAVRDTDAFKRVETRRVASGCGNEMRDREVRSAPAALNGGEVQSVLSALIAARSALGNVDANRDGVLDAEEAKARPQPAQDDLAGRLAASVVDGYVKPHERDFADWAHAAHKAQCHIDYRHTFDRDLQEIAQFRAQTPAGAEALTWAYRALHCERRTHLSEVTDALRGAEGSWLRFIPFTKVTDEAGHLSDREIRKHLDTDDLASFVTRTKAALTEKLGGPYAETWLRGTDIEGHEALSDPDRLTVALPSC